MAEEVKEFDPGKFSPKTVDEAANLALSWLAEESLKNFADDSREHVCGSVYHFNFGLLIRNAMMWHGKSPELMQACGEDHPDSASAVVIKRAWEMCQEWRCAGTFPKGMWPKNG